MVDAREIFKGFCRYYNSLNILFSESLSTHTGRLVSYFDTLGRMLGYRIYSEYTMKTLGVKCPKDMENRKTDMAWWYFADEGERQFELAVELQQSFNLPEYVKDIKKLVAFPAKLKVFYCATKNHKKVVQAVKKELKSKGAKDESQFLVILDPWINPSTFGKGTLKGLLLNRKSQVTGEGSAKVKEFIDGVHQVRLLLDVQWKSKEMK